ncbi:MAG: class I SAM-dependent methyltransferase [Nanoarchaeota archaeon]
MEEANTSKQMLAKRIEVHDKYSKHDIDDWIFGIIKLKNKESVLDVGCGTGKQLIPISDKTKGLVIGIDISSESLDLIREKTKGKDNVKLILSSIEEIHDKLSGHHFDLIISCFAIYYSKNPEETLLQLKALLEEHGRLFLCGPSLENNKELLELHSQIAELPKMHKGFFENFAINFLKKNFKKVEVFRFTNPIDFPDVNSLVDYWLSYKIGDKSKVEVFRKAAISKFKNGKFRTVKEVIGVLAFK